MASLTRILFIKDTFLLTCAIVYQKGRHCNGRDFDHFVIPPGQAGYLDRVDA